jgi:ABC-type glycerol-3-phosphate transport system permease component
MSMIRDVARQAGVSTMTVSRVTLLILAVIAPVVLMAVLLERYISRGILLGAVNG